MKKSRTTTWVLLLLVAGAAGYYGWQRYQSEDRATAAANAQKAAARVAVRVSIAPVEKSDFPVYLTGLGTVQGFNTVVVRTRVDDADQADPVVAAGLREPDARVARGRFDDRRPEIDEAALERVLDHPCGRPVL